MAKLTREDKIEIYLKRKQGESFSSLVEEYKMPSSCIDARIENGHIK